LVIFTACFSISMRHIIIAAVFLLPSLALAQGYAGARSAGLAGNAVTLSDEWSALNNQAGMAFSEGVRAGVFYESRFMMKELGDKGFAASVPVGPGAFGISFRSFGYNLFTTSRAGLAYGIRLSPKLSLGAQANYHRVRIAEGYGSTQTVSVEGGMIYRMNENLTIAFHLFNPTRARLAEFNDERMPGILKAGASYAFSQKVRILGEIRKPSDRKPTMAGAIEYQVADAVSLRAGAGANPGTTTFGIGWQFGHWRMDAATSYHTLLGFTPQISLAYSPQEKP
jgi:hypothetical protein